MRKYDKSPIKLRGRKMPSGNTSLYLDIYYNGQREYEYLKLYLIPEKTKADRLKNRQTMEFAEAVQAKRIVELRNGEYGFKQQRGGTMPFFAYYQAEAIKRYGTTDPNKWKSWGSVYHLLKGYESKENIKLKDITPQWIEGFKAYMDTRSIKNASKPIANSSKALYLSKVITLLNKAVKEGLIDRNPTASVERYRVSESKREYLTKEEITALSNTPCRRDEVRRAFLFSCLTGLRYSDVSTLTWEQVHQQGDFVRLIYRQRKTQAQEYLDISPQAVGLMGERGAPDALVFEGLPSEITISSTLKAWTASAGISKHITFHCARHTFATLMLDIGTDLYTVSKLLGHREIGTTQIYARILDKNKQKAVASIPNLIG